MSERPNLCLPDPLYMQTFNRGRWVSWIRGRPRHERQVKSTARGWSWRYKGYGTILVFPSQFAWNMNRRPKVVKPACP